MIKMMGQTRSLEASPREGGDDKVSHKKDAADTAGDPPAQGRSVKQEKT